MTYWERLSALNLHSLQRRRERYILIHTWKINRGLVPNDLHVTFIEHRRHGTQAKVPAFNREANAKAKTCYDNSFHVKAARLWNIIPSHTKNFESLTTFLDISMNGLIFDRENIAELPKDRKLIPVIIFSSKV